VPLFLLLLTALLGCVRRTPTAPAIADPASALAPNEAVVTARVIDAAIVDSATLSIEPAQPICILTLDVTAASGSDRSLPGVGTISGTIQVYSKQVELVSLKGGTLTASVEARGDGPLARLWVTQVHSPTPPR
jgi:hypothetical protein